MNKIKGRKTRALDIAILKLCKSGCSLSELKHELDKDGYRTNDLTDVACSLMDNGFLERKVTIGPMKWTTTSSGLEILDSHITLESSDKKGQNDGKS